MTGERQRAVLVLTSPMTRRPTWSYGSWPTAGSRSSVPTPAPISTRVPR